MTRRRPTGPALALAAALLIAAAPPAAAQDGEQLQAEVKKLRAENEELRRRNAALEAELAKLRATLGQTKEEATAAKQQAAAAQQRAVSLEREVTELTQTTEQLEQEKASADQAKRERYVAVETDPQTGQTTLSTQAVRFRATHGSRADHWVNLSCRPAGRSPSGSPPVASFHLQAWFSGDTFRTAETLEITVDGQTSRVERTDYNTRRRITGSSKRRVNKSDEFADFDLPMELVRSVGRAEQVTARLGPARFVFSREMVEMFDALAEAAAQP